MKQRFSILSAFLVCALLWPARTSALTGSWRGELTVGQTGLTIVFNFTETGDGATQCTLDSPLQGAKGIPATVLLCTSDSVSLRCDAVGATYEGRILTDAIEGTFRQRGYAFPLRLTPEIPIEVRRPQTPRPPFPYAVTDTTFTAPDGAVMSATLTMPYRLMSTKIPVVLMVSGSGPQNRDEEIFDHRPFAVIADCLARHGIGSLRYDDRGVGKSTGDFPSATTATFKEDARSGIAFLRSIGAVGKVGVLGHSEGGTIAFMLGAEGCTDFIISLAGMAVTGKETMMRQNSHALDLAGVTGEEKETSLRLIELVSDTVAEQSRNGVCRPIDIDSVASAAGLQVSPQIVSSLKATQKVRTPWFDGFFALNPPVYLKDVKCPMLALNGDRDTQVDGVANTAMIRKLVPQAEVRLLPGLNHLMQQAVTGEIAEYNDIRETLSPEVLTIIADFVNRVTENDGKREGATCGSTRH